MKTLRILTAAVVAAFAVAAQAAPYGPGPGCAAGATPGTAGCPAYGSGPGARHGPRGAGMQERFKAADTNADGMISREEAHAALPRLYQNFDAIDVDKNGLLTQAEMQNARLAHRADRGMRGEGWKKWDANGDGMLSREEVAGAPRLSERFDALDADRNGLLTQAEMQNARLAHGGGRGMRGEGWKKWDANGDGMLSREEVAGAPRLSQEFDAIDANRDGFLSVEELRSGHAGHGGRGPQS